MALSNNFSVMTASIDLRKIQIDGDSVVKNSNGETGYLTLHVVIVLQVSFRTHGCNTHSSKQASIGTAQHPASPRRAGISAHGNVPEM
jgi:hypothetical protein